MGYRSKGHYIEMSRFWRIVSAPIFWAVLLIMILYDTLVFRFKVAGRENLRGLHGKGCFLISNHTLYLDPGVIGHAIAPRRARYSAMEKTFDLPFVGNFIRFLGAFPIPSTNGLQKLVRPVKRMLEGGWFVHFFPEGDLMHRNQAPAPFAPGVFFLSQLLDCPVIPVTLVLLPWTLLGGRISPRFFRVKIVIGKPIFPAGFRSAGGGLRASVEAMARHARRTMCDCIRTERDPPGVPAQGVSVREYSGLTAPAGPPEGRARPAWRTSLARGT
jgi:1-acyl-sn-glycerol-3-phosphate acyltransferase